MTSHSSYSNLFEIINVIWDLSRLQTYNNEVGIAQFALVMGSHGQQSRWAIVLFFFVCDPFYLWILNFLAILWLWTMISKRIPDIQLLVWKYGEVSVKFFKKCGMLLYVSKTHNEVKGSSSIDFPSHWISPL